MSRNNVLARAAVRARFLAERLPEPHRPDISESWGNLLDDIEFLGDAQAIDAIEVWITEFEQRCSATALHLPLNEEVAVKASTLDLLADRVADRVFDRLSDLLEEREDNLIDVAEVARRFKVSPSYVYDHAEDLGVIRLGDGAKPRLRFDPVTVFDHLAARPAPAAAPSSPRRRPQSSDLLPIKDPSS